MRYLPKWIVRLHMAQFHSLISTMHELICSLVHLHMKFNYFLIIFEFIKLGIQFRLQIMVFWTIVGAAKFRKYIDSENPRGTDVHGYIRAAMIKCGGIEQTFN